MASYGYPTFQTFQPAARPKPAYPATTLAIPGAAARSIPFSTAPIASGTGAPPPVGAGGNTRVAVAAPSAPKPADPYASFSYNQDPILAQIRLLGQGAVSDALSGGDAARKQLLINYGDPTIARQAMFGGKGFTLPGIGGGADYTVADTTHQGDEATALAAQQNSFSTMARLARAHEEQQHALDEWLNSQGLFYSGERAKQLTDEQTAYQGQQADAYQQLAAALSGVDTQIQGAYQAEGSRQMQAEQEAYLRALAAAAGATPPAPDGSDVGAPGQNFGGGNDVVPTIVARAPVRSFEQLHPPTPTQIRKKIQQSAPGGRGGV